MIDQCRQKRCQDVKKLTWSVSQSRQVTPRKASGDSAPCPRKMGIRLGNHKKLRADPISLTLSRLEAKP